MSVSVVDNRNLVVSKFWLFEGVAFRRQVIFNDEYGCSRAMIVVRERDGRVHTIKPKDISFAKIPEEVKAEVQRVHMTLQEEFDKVMRASR